MDSPRSPPSFKRLEETNNPYNNPNGVIDTSETFDPEHFFSENSSPLTVMSESSSRPWRLSPQPLPLTLLPLPPLTLSPLPLSQLLPSSNLLLSPPSQQPSKTTSVQSVPLRQWIHNHDKASEPLPPHSLSLEWTKQSILRKTTVAFAIGELLQYYALNMNQYYNGRTANAIGGDDIEKEAVSSSYSKMAMMAVASIDNFIVREEEEEEVREEVSNTKNSPQTSGSGRAAFRDKTSIIQGVDMISPSISLRIVAPSFLSDDFLNGLGVNDEDGATTTTRTNNNLFDASFALQREEELGQYLEVEIHSSESILTTTNATNNAMNGNDTSTEEEQRQQQLDPREEMNLCHSFGTLLYQLYSGSPPVPNNNEGQQQEQEQQHWQSSPSQTDPLPLQDTSLHSLGLVDDDNREHSFSDSFSDSFLEQQPVAKKAMTEDVGISSFPKAAGKASATNKNHHKNSNHKNNKSNPNNPHGVAAANKTHPKSTNKPPPPSPLLKDLGYPSSLSLLVKNLLDCGWDYEFRPDDAMPSLNEAKRDLHLLLLEPKRFLFDRLGGTVMLNIKQHRMYGREAERSLIIDVFCRVSLTGESEALFIEGFSGSGKSKLVQSVVEYADVAGGYIVRKKFDDISQERPISVVIAAFNDLCPMIREKNSPEELNVIVGQLMSMFGSQLSTLARLLPNVTLLIPNLTSSSYENRGSQSTEQNNTSNVCVILQLFTRVVSSKSHPVMLFLDDLHWADSASLDILRYVLSDMKGSSCVYLIGSYRSNEVSSDHAVFGLMSNLKRCNVQLSRVQLDGLEIEEVNQMVSDALGIFPRITKPLSQLVLRKTKGNPLFVLECLRSLIAHDLLRYSFRERRWVWDTDTIGAEDIADNVCKLFSTKMMALPENTQLALKVASCFGTTVNSMIVESLASCSVNFAGLQSELEKAVDNDFMDKDGSAYRFVHDKVREAAYGLILEMERDQFHQNVGWLLYRSSLGSKDDDMIFFITDQINHGTVEDPHQCIIIAELNYKAASKAMGNSNFAAAHFYSNAAMRLLPEDCWESHYDLSRNIFLVSGNAAYSDGQPDEAMSALNNLLIHGKSLKDKLDGYYLKIALLHTRQESKPAYDTCLEVLEQLGEVIPTIVEPRIFVKKAETLNAKLNQMSESEFMNFKKMDNPFHHFLMQFYNQVCHLSYFVNAPMLKWFAYKIAELSLEHGFCKFSAIGLMRYAMVLSGKLLDDVKIGYKVGKMALKLLDRFDAIDVVSGVYLCYYGYIAVHIEPFQSCADMLKRGFEAALSTGDTQTALLNSLHYLQKCFVSGGNLSVLKKECDYQMRLVEAHSLPFFKVYTSAWEQTISMIIAREGSSSLTSSDDTSRVEDLSEAKVFHGVLQNFWFGHYDRCMYYAERSPALTDISKLKNIMVVFYSGLSCFHCSRKINTKHMKVAKRAVEVMKQNGRGSSWNYKNKVHLLEAEIYSARGKKDEAKVSFNAAISAARSSKFTHEEGLAYELSAYHSLKLNDNKDALNLFEEARDCYKKWGSQVKVDLVTKQIKKITAQ
eukprot:CAMPEP_0183723104 /NCGR_PEP_ID=MMETSP0737-20130205/14816_1 /TAXON_ID=385413 /ORGANISM="Thalassiosira miniscula, Strain CCMP1093" /LENGTH=1533 /DNA_ID=CAMNT_0025953355 /DNA_START=8 /DNA_END=4609 /DNA_ORIENTATION=-